MDIESAKKEVCEVLDRLQAAANEDAMTEAFSNPKKLLEPLFAETLYLGVHDMGYRDRGDLSDLTFYIRDMDNGEYVKTYNPVDDIISIVTEDGLLGEEISEMIDRGIAALQSGIDRLEALRRKAQP